MDAQQIRYIEQEMYTVAPLPVVEGENGQFKLQITSERGKTKWLNITNEQFKKIENILLGADCLNK
jgi:hypothetical protein